MDIGVKVRTFRSGNVRASRHETGKTQAKPPAPPCISIVCEGWWSPADGSDGSLTYPIMASLAMAEMSPPAASFMTSEMVSG
jgi:hypothetical protein